MYLVQEPTLDALLHDARSPHADVLFASDSGGRLLAELLIDCEEDRTLRAVLVGMLREMDRR